MNISFGVIKSRINVPNRKLKIKYTIEDQQPIEVATVEDWDYIKYVNALKYHNTNSGVS